MLTTSRIATLGFILGISTNAFAGMFPEEGKGKGIWRIAGEAVNLQQSANVDVVSSAGAAFGLLTEPMTSVSTDGASEIPFFAVDTPFDWGWGIDLAYIFPSH